MSMSPMNPSRRSWCDAVPLTIAPAARAARRRAHGVTPRQIELVRSTWAATQPISDAAATIFYDRLFEVDPAVRRLFAETDMAAQRRILMQTFAVIVASLDDFDAVVPVIRALGQVHARHGVREEHYDSVAAALLWTLDRGLGETFDDEAADAWATAYSAIAAVMIEAAADIGREAAAAAV
jgi:hemoglobin-like flavoprotein